MAIITLQCFLVHLKAFHRICLVYCGLLSCPEKGVLGFLLTLDSVEVHVVFVLQSLSCVQLFAIPQTAALQASLFFTISQSLLKLMSVELVNRELADVQAGFRRGRGIRDQIANIHWITEKTREFQKNIYF